MSESLLSRPVVTVASIVERDGRFLLVEEETRSGLKFNQPAGHLEPGEALIAATFVRFSFAADAHEHDASRALDVGIARAVWMSYEEIVARRADHRTPLVLRCIDDYRAGVRWPLDLLRGDA
jgi:8-oxo-dGTP pyrophosphatase MutT (NUDIX family)